MIVLSIDWDYVTGDRSSSPSCCGRCPENLASQSTYSPSGSGRPNALYRPGKDTFLNPTPLWKKRLRQVLALRVRRGAEIYVAECHALMEYILRGREPTEIYDYDAHWDADPSPELDGCTICGNWVQVVRRRGHKVVGGWHVPNHQEAPYPKSPTKPADLVFFCQSSPWTPRTMDAEFFRLVREFAKRARVEVKCLGHTKRRLERFCTP